MSNVAQGTCKDGFTIEFTNTTLPPPPPLSLAGGDDYKVILGTQKSITRNIVERQCFTVETSDDDEEEEPERLGMTGTAVSHLIEFNPNTTVIWIVDDDSKCMKICMKVQVYSTLHMNEGNLDPTNYTRKIQKTQNE